PVYLDSIALGAEPKTQVQKIRAIVGDSDPTFNEYLGELEMAGDEKPEVIKKAVDIVTAYYNEHLAGDEKTVEVKKEDKDGKEEKNVEVKKDGKETKDIEVKKDGDKKDVTVKEAGDEDKDKKSEAGDKCGGDAVDMDVLADKVAARLLAAQKPVETPKTAGDEELDTPLGGDSKPEVKSSDDFMKDIWG
ncbi:MAG: hypothetical protein J6Q48_02390, partial [Bacteroidaceae bacterium]|nr:hypothetical protein [Bacteroidaceae bacterium]